ncbi:MAG: CsgG/HfaB family protein [Treponema sp.]|nr:CsgG/HfaB family protein [Treponema sp.]
MKKLPVVAFLLVISSFAAFPQTKPRLGILPFTGGAGEDGETIATLFSFQSEILEAFTVVPRTNAVNALIAEQNFQMAGYTDSDTVARIGRQLNADYVVSGNIRRLGNSNLVIATIINVQTFEQLAGDYREYRRIEEVRALLPEISSHLIAATRRDTSMLPRLAVAPFNVVGHEANVQEAETLAQILAIEIANTGRYSVLPRTVTLQAALRELDYQMQGYTAEEGAKALGQAINAEYVLFAEVRSLGSLNMFTAQILKVEDGSLLTGNTRDYQVIDDGIKLMADLAFLLTGNKPVVSISPTSNIEKDKKSRLWTAGASIGTSFSPPWFILTVRTTLAPFKKSFLEAGCDFGFASGVKDVGYNSFYPFIHYAYFRPFEKKGGWYLGSGFGFMLARYRYPTGDVPANIFAMDFITGFNIGNLIDISYTLRTNFSRASPKISVGYSCRFK